MYNINEKLNYGKRVYLSSPTMHGDELKYMKEAYDTNWMSTVGANIDAIESDIAEKIGRKYAVALLSGTAALHLAVKAAGVKAGDKVFCTDMTFAATVNPIVYENAEPIFIDSDYESWNMSPEALEKAFELYPDVKYIMVANLYGNASKLDEIESICKEHGAFLIEDACESFGAIYKGKYTGNYGDISVISFNGNKIITGSSGGMLLTDNKYIADRVRKWSTQSRDLAPWYQHSEIGYNYRISNVIAGVVRGQFIHMDEHIAQKKAVYERYKEGLKGLPVTVNPSIGTPNWWLSCLLIDKDAMCKQMRDDHHANFVGERGKTCPTEILNAFTSNYIEGRPIWKPMHMQPIYKKYAHIGGEVCEDIFERGLCLPSDNKITKEEQKIIIKIIRACFD